MTEELRTQVIPMQPSTKQLEERVATLQRENERLKDVISNLEEENNYLNRMLTHRAYSMLRYRGGSNSSSGGIIVACITIIALFLIVYGMGVFDFDFPHYTDASNDTYTEQPVSRR